MPREYGRNRRVADLVQRELAVLLQRERSGSGGSLLTVSGADVSPDLAQARIYVTTLGADADQQRLVRELNQQAGHYRHALARNLKLRSVPRLTFVYDHSVERGARLSSLIDSLHADPDAAADGGE